MRGRSLCSSCSFRTGSRRCHCLASGKDERELESNVTKIIQKLHTSALPTSHRSKFSHMSRASWARQPVAEILCDQQNLQNMLLWNRRRGNAYWGELTVSEHQLISKELQILVRLDPEPSFLITSKHFAKKKFFYVYFYI